MHKYFGFIIIVLVFVGGAVWQYVTQHNAVTTDDVTTTIVNDMSTTTNSTAEGSFVTDPADTNSSQTDDGMLVSYAIEIDADGMSPAKITATVGQTLWVTLTNTSSVSQVFTIDELMVNSGLLEPGGSTVVTIIPSQTGIYMLRSSVATDPTSGATGTLTVE